MPHFLFSPWMSKTPVKHPPCISVQLIPACTLQIQYRQLFSVLKNHFTFSKYTENSKQLETKDSFVCNLSILHLSKEENLHCAGGGCDGDAGARLGAGCSLDPRVPSLLFSEGNSQILTCQLPQKNSWSVACTCWMLMIGLENISGFSVGSHSSMQEETCGSGVRLIHLSGSQCSMGWKGEELLCRGGSSSPWESIGFGSQWLDMLSPCTMSLPCASVLPAHCLGLIPDVHK